MRLLLFTLVGLWSLAVFAGGEIEQSSEWIEIHGNGVLTTAQKNQAEKRLAAVEKDFKGGDRVRMAERANTAMRAIFHIATLNLRRYGHYDTAREVESGWGALDGELIRMVKAGGTRNISDFAPWSEKLAVLYLIIEAKLGYKLCYTLRITDLATLIWTPTVVFHPCKYGETEFLLHFAANDPRYRSFMPVVSYWITSITCSIATFGVGYFFVCSPLAMAVELGCEKVVAPRLGEFIFEKACLLSEGTGTPYGR